jgi:uncharacterized protein DUF6270
VIGIFGSCVTRDLFDHPALRPSLGHYVARCSVVSAVADPVATDEDSVVVPSAWQRRRVLADFQKTCFAQFAASVLDRLVIDLIDERFDLLRVDGSYVTRSSAFDAGKLCEPLADAGHRWRMGPFHYEQSYNDHAAAWLRDLREAA